MFTVGIDVGSVSLKFVVLGSPGDLGAMEGLARANPDLFRGPFFTADGRPFLCSPYHRIKATPFQATRELLERWLDAFPDGILKGIRVTGSGAKLVGEVLGVEVENEFKAVAEGVGSCLPDVRTIFEMGGESSKYLLIEPGEEGVQILDYETNGDCAAGTGSFMDQQAARLEYDIEEVGDLVMATERSATIAGRCSVFAKTDMIHAQQRGYTPQEVLKGLCEAVARNFKGTIVKGKNIVPPVAFVGGVAANKGVVWAMREAFELGEGELTVPKAYAWMGALGAAVVEARGHGRRMELERFRAYRVHHDFPTAEPLSLENVVLLRDLVRPYELPDEGKVEAYLGIDVGSVSTNFALITPEGELIYEIYTRTRGRPVEVVAEGLREIEEKVGDRVEIMGVGTTGSGRELIGELVGADTVNDEITAHKTGATFIAEKFLGEEVDTIFEIGGQDSKFISIQNGVVVDFTMNEACAAGTGSFLEEQAEKLGINIVDEFAQKALSSKSPIRLGERCTVFMERDLVSYLQKGARLEDLVAGLAYSVVHNYLNRVVRGRYIGDHIFFQGGTAYNDAVAAAFSKVLGKRIVVPPYNGVIGAIGMALLAKEKVEHTGKRTRFRGYRLDQVDYKVREFVCKGCPNRCVIKEFTIEGERTYWGDKCSERYRKRAKVERKPSLPDLVALRRELLFEGYEEGKGGSRGSVGIPRSMYTYDRFPFWNAFFRELGFSVVLSDETNREIIEEGIEASVAEPCFPIKVAHGHILALVRKGVDYIFQPNVINEETDHPEVQSHLCVWGQTLPFVAARSPLIAPHRHKLLSPTVHFREGRERVREELKDFGRSLGIPKKEVKRAVDAAYEAQESFRRKLLEAGEEALRTLRERDELGIVLVGRPYNTNDRGVNMDLPGKLRKYYGVDVIPMDMLPLWGTDIREINDNMFWNYGRKILQAAKVVAQYPNLHIIYISNFKCGPDSYIKHFVREASGGKPFLSLQLDEHSNDAGVLTRCEAYLDSKGFLRWWTRRVA